MKSRNVRKKDLCEIGSYEGIGIGGWGCLLIMGGVVWWGWGCVLIMEGLIWWEWGYVLVMEGLVWYDYLIGKSCYLYKV